MTPKPGKKPAMKPSTKEMGLRVKRESIYDKMLMATKTAEHIHGCTVQQVHRRDKLRALERGIRKSTWKRLKCMFLDKLIVQTYRNLSHNVETT